MEKATLTSKQAKAIEYAKKHYDINTLIATHASYSSGWSASCYHLREIDLDTLIKAIYIGYEIKKTPEEKLADTYVFYENHGLVTTDSFDREKCHMVCQGIKIAVDELGLKIEGINT